MFGKKNKKINRTSYVRYHDTAAYKSVVTGHQGNNTIAGQRRRSRSRKREFLIWIFEKAVYETGGRVCRKVHETWDWWVRREDLVVPAVQAVRASSGTRGDQSVGGSGGGRRHDWGEESTAAMKRSNWFKGNRLSKRMETAEEIHGGVSLRKWIDLKKMEEITGSWRQLKIFYSSHVVQVVQE